MPGDNITAGNLIVNVMTKLTDFKKGMGEVEGRFDSVKKKVDKSRSAINTAGKAIAGVGLAVGAALAGAVMSTAKFADNMNKMSLRTGESAKTLSGLAFAADRAGADIGSVEKAIKRAAGNMNDASQGIGEAKDAFDQLGITVVNTDGSLKKGSELLFDFADATKDMEDSSLKAALAQDIFGKAGTTLLPLFADGSAGMKELTDEADALGFSIDDTAAKMGADFVDAITNVKGAIRGFVTEGTKDLLPIFTSLGNAIATTMSDINGGLEGATQGDSPLFKVVETFIGGIGMIIDGWIKLYDTIDQVFEDAVLLAVSAVEGIYNAFKWVFEKLGVDLPDLDQLFEDLKETSDSTADKLTVSWNKFKDSYKANLEEQKKATKITNKEIERINVDTAEDITEVHNEEIDKQIKKEEELTAKAIAEDDKKLASRKSKLEEEELATLHWFDELQIQYDYVLDEEQLKQAEVLKTMGGDWQAYLDDIIAKTPSAFDVIFADVGTRFNERLDGMGDAWMEEIHHGSFRSAIEFMGDSLVQTLESAFLDIGGNIIQSFVDMLRNKITASGVGQAISGALAGVGGGAGGLIGSAGGALAGVGGALGGVAAVAAPIAIAAGVGYGAYKLGEEIFASMGYKHTSQRERSRKATKDQSHVAARWAGYKGLSTGLNYTKMNSRLMNETMFWADKSDISPEDAAIRGSRSLAQQLQNDFGSANLSPERAAEVAAILHDAVLGYRSGTLQSMAAEGIFHAGGVIPGMLGQEKVIRALAGEEVITRGDPRHTQNIGQGMVVQMNFSGMNSMLDAKMAGKLAGEEILKQLKYQTKFTR